jgi:hypothetical protein
MTRQIAGTVSLIVFAMCLVEGLRAENPFTTVVSRALLALVVTFVVGMVIGLMATRMLKESGASVQNVENK